jgi:hypothetical protein
LWSVLSHASAARWQNLSPAEVCGRLRSSRRRGTVDDPFAIALSRWSETAHLPNEPAFASQEQLSLQPILHKPTHREHSGQTYAMLPIRTQPLRPSLDGDKGAVAAKNGSRYLEKEKGTQWLNGTLTKSLIAVNELTAFGRLEGVTRTA